MGKLLKMVSMLRTPGSGGTIVCDVWGASLEKWVEFNFVHINFKMLVIHLSEKTKRLGWQSGSHDRVPS